MYTQAGKLHKSMSRSLGTDTMAGLSHSWLCCDVDGAPTPLLTRGSSNCMSPGWGDTC